MIVKRNMNKEKWINEVMDSLDDLKSAEVNPFLYNRILSKINSKNAEYTPAKLVWMAAASFVILIALNFQAIKTNNSKREKNTIQEIASQYNLSNSNPINYNQ